MRKFSFCRIYLFPKWEGTKRKTEVSLTSWGSISCLTNPKLYKLIPCNKYLPHTYLCACMHDWFCFSGWILTERRYNLLYCMHMDYNVQNIPALESELRFYSDPMISQNSTSLDSHSSVNWELVTIPSYWAYWKNWMRKWVYRAYWWNCLLPDQCLNSCLILLTLDLELIPLHHIVPDN